MMTIDSTTADNHESTLGTGTNDLETDTGAHTNLYFGHIEGAFGLFGNSIDTDNCIHESCVDDETNSNCDTCLVEDESVRLGGMNSISLDFVNHGHT